MKEVMISSDTVIEAAVEAMFVLMRNYAQSPEEAGTNLGVIFSCIGKLHAIRHPEFNHHELRDAIIAKIRSNFSGGAQ